MSLRTGGRKTYSAPLSSGTVKDMRAASIVSARAGVQSRIDAATLDVLGQPITPETGLLEAIGLVRGTVNVQGGRLLLGEGVWQFNSTLTIDCPKLELVAMYPGRTIFRRSVSASTPMISITAERVSLHGITFEDPESTEMCVIVSADRCNVVNCVFDDTYGAIELASADYCMVTGNRVETYVAASPIDLTGTSSFNVVANNVVV